MRIVICHMGYTGYAAACWRALSMLPNVNLKVYSPETEHGYDSHVLSGVVAEVIPNDEFESKHFPSAFCDKVVTDNPDAIIVGGWSSLAFRTAVYDKRLTSVRKLLLIDTMWTGSWRQLASRWAYHSYFRNFDGVIVAGERGRQFARWIGFGPEEIFTSSYGFDAPAFQDCLACRQKKSWPHRFIYVGRYVPIKGVDILVEAYEKYRRRFGSEAWELHCFGRGALDFKLTGVPGIVDRGFLQPKDLPTALTEAGVFVLPSMKDPWGVALVEGAGAGLPLIASDEVSSSVDVLRHMYNGCVVPAGDSNRLFKALSWMHEHYEQLPEMGRRSKVYAYAYAPDVWASRILEAVRA